MSLLDVLNRRLRKVFGVPDLDLAKTAEEFQELGVEIRRLEARKKTLKNLLEAAIEGREELEVGGYKVAWVQSSSLDQAGLRAAHPEIDFARFRKPHRYVRVSGVKE